MGCCLTTYKLGTWKTSNVSLVGKEEDKTKEDEEEKKGATVKNEDPNAKTERQQRENGESCAKY